MHFIRDGITGEQLREAWQEGFQGNTGAPAADLRNRFARFTALFDSTTHRDDLILLAYLPGDGTTVSFNGREAVTIPGPDFMQALLRIWFGDQPADSGLKEHISRELQDRAGFER